MALSFRERNRSHPIQFVLALLALLIALAMMVMWIWIGYRQSIPSSPSYSVDDSSQYVEPLTDVQRCLLILDYAETDHFLLLQTDPAHNRIVVAHIPAQLADADRNTLPTLLQKHGPLRVRQTVSNALDLTINRYILLNADGTQRFLDKFDSGIRFTLPENIHYTDDNGAQIRLSAGEHTLSGAQSAAVMQYTAWNNASVANTIVTDMVSAVLNQYLTPNRPLDGYFSALSNASQTDLRIDNFNASRRTLSQLADNNQGSVCYSVKIEGAIENGLFLPDVKTMRQHNELYQ